METNFEIEHRLCLKEVNINRLRLLGYCHSLYHLIRRSPECFDSDGFVRDSRFIQNFAVESVRAIKPLISDDPVRVLSQSGNGQHVSSLCYLNPGMS